MGAGAPAALLIDRDVSAQPGVATIRFTRCNRRVSDMDALGMGPTTRCGLGIHDGPDAARAAMDPNKWASLDDRVADGGHRFAAATKVLHSVCQMATHSLLSPCVDG